MHRTSGRHFLQIPGPTNVPDRVLHAMAKPTSDHRGKAFSRLARGLLQDVRHVFRTESPVVIYPSSGTGAWESALVNTLSPGDRVVVGETGHFSSLWAQMGRDLGLDVEVLRGDWRGGVDPERVEQRLEEDRSHEIKALAVVHNETSTGATTRVGDVRAAMDRAGHPAMLLVDTISSLGSIDYRHDEWGVDVTVSCSQKGLMLPPGLGFTAISDKARHAASLASLPRSYWDWESMLAANEDGWFPYTPATNLLYGLREALDMLFEEGLEAVFARHKRHAAATRAAVHGWGLDVWCTTEAEQSSVLTAVLVPESHDADHVRAVILDAFDMSLGAGLSHLRGRVFRIGHLGDLNDLMLAGTLSGVEMGLQLAEVPISHGGVLKALEFLRDSAGSGGEG